MKKFILLVILVSFTHITVAQNIEVSQIDFATAINDRQPVGTDTAFAATVSNVYCYTHITGAENPTEIYHVWYHQEEERARVQLSVKSNDWRTWSSKSILESWTGSWRVVVEDADGNELASQSFVIRETE